MRTSGTHQCLYETSVYRRDTPRVNDFSESTDENPGDTASTTLVRRTPGVGRSLTRVTPVISTGKDEPHPEELTRWKRASEN